MANLRFNCLPCGIMDLGAKPYHNHLLTKSHHDKDNWDCQLCDLKTTSWKNFLEHLHGVEHKMKMGRATGCAQMDGYTPKRMKKTPDPMMQAMVVDEINEEHESQPHNYKDKKEPMKGTEKAVLRALHHCEVCDVNVPGKSIKQHRQGRKHRQRCGQLDGYAQKDDYPVKDLRIEKEILKYRGKFDKIETVSNGNIETVLNGHSKKETHQSNSVFEVKYRRKEVETAILVDIGDEASKESAPSYLDMKRWWLIKYEEETFLKPPLRPKPAKDKKVRQSANTPNVNNENNIEPVQSKSGITKSPNENGQSFFRVGNVLKCPKDEYDLSGPKVFVIINNYFKGKEIERRGSDKDVEILEKLFEGYGFQIEKWLDLTLTELIQKLKDFRKQLNTTNYSIFGIFLGSHKYRKGILTADHEVFNPYGLPEFFNSRKCPGMIDKPKLFFGNFCQGTLQNSVPGTTEEDASEVKTRFWDIDSLKTLFGMGQGKIIIKRDKVNSDDDNQSEHDLHKPLNDAPDINEGKSRGNILESSDYMYVYSTSKKYTSNRHPDHGSFFVLMLHETLKSEMVKHGHLEDALITLRRIMKKMFQENFTDKGQISMSNTTLTKKVRFEKKRNISRFSLTAPETFFVIAYFFAFITLISI